MHSSLNNDRSARVIFGDGVGAIGATSPTIHPRTRRRNPSPRRQRNASSSLGTRCLSPSAAQSFALSHSFTEVNVTRATIVAAPGSHASPRLETFAG